MARHPLWSPSPAPWFLVLASCLLGGCSPAQKGDAPLQGYVEGEFALIAAPAAGTLAQLQVRRGQQIESGAPLFALEEVNEQAARREAAERLHGAEQRLANLRAERRPPEVEAANAQAAQAAAAIKLSTEQLQQQEKLHAGGFISRASLDQARARYEQDIARLKEVEAQARLARLPLGRDAEIQAAAAEAAAARATLEQSEWRLAQRAVRAPAAGLVQDTYFVQGEWIAAGRPVVSLLPAGNVKVRFFLPEQRVGAVQQGDRVSIACDGCGSPFAATVSYVSKQAEYTPPIIYSKDSRAKLVFMLEARPAPEDAARLRPGQPVDITLSSLPRDNKTVTAP